MYLDLYYVQSVTGRLDKSKNLCSYQYFLFFNLCTLFIDTCIVVMLYT